MGKISYDGKMQELVAGKTMFDFADELAVQVPTSCGRTGHCHECIVEVRKGMEALAPRTEAESFLRGDYRLACQASVQDVGIEVEFAPLRRKPKILSLHDEKPVELAPLVTRQGDVVLYDGEEVDRYRGHIYGIAMDLGTTTVVMDLVDLETGKSVHVSSFENPQRFGGSDVMHRISYDGKFPGELRKAVVNAVNHEIHELEKRYGFVRQEIYEIVVAGNSTMRDLLFRLDVQGIGQRPYKSTVENEYLAGERETTAILQGTRRLGLRGNAKARVYGLPLVASHVGGDTAADLVAIEMASQDGVVMLVDVGTNTEVVVGHAGRLLAASCPAGPAFEGGGVKYGMPGYDGAIESIRIEDGKFVCSTIGDVAPQGICGSGLIDLLAELRRHGLMQPKGQFKDRSYEMTIVPEHGITFSREDASNLAQAKAANTCGQWIAMRHFGVGPEDIQKLYLAGGFANYVDVKNAIEIGFLAPVAEDRIVKIGNAAVQGAREVLLSRKKRTAIEELVKQVEHIELETTPDFFEVFVEGCQFKPMPEAFVAPEVS
ncbi:MAG: ASKHA domain-containing protein [bacterium]|nr:ASKHA domain-containing protein [bacterium]